MIIHIYYLHRYIDNMHIYEYIYITFVFETPAMDGLDITTSAINSMQLNYYM